MKFNEGVWYGREHVQVATAIEVNELVTNLDDSASSYRNPPSAAPFIRALCTTRHIQHRGDLLNKPVLTVSVTSPAAGIIGIEAVHFYGKSKYHEPTAPHFPGGVPANVGEPTVSVTPDSASLTTAGGAASAVVDTRESSFAIDICDAAGETVTSLGKDSVQWILDAAASPRDAVKENAATTINDPYYRAPDKRRQSYMALSVGLGVNDKVYGFGERFGPFIKNGQKVESSNDDGGTSSDSAYKCIPFYLTNRNYGVLVDHLDHVSYEVQSDRMTTVQMSVPGERIRIYIIVGDGPKDVLSKYTLFTGRAPLVPDWSFGLWLSTSFLTDYDEKTVMSYVDRMAALDIPLSVFHFDCFWMRAHAWCDFQFDPKFFPDPAGFLKRLHAKGLKVSVWLNPWVGQASRLFAEGEANGYFVKRRDGTTFQSDDWQPGTATVDFTNPAAKQWWQRYLADLLDLGVDCFKTDFGERIITEDVVYHDGSNPRTMHNAYCLLYQQAVYEVIVAKRGVDEAIVFARSATTGTQRFPVHWGGDVDSKWTGLAETIRGGLSLGLSGFGYHSSDIGGFKSEGKAGGDSGMVPPATVYKRWVQFGMLSSHSRLHGSASYRVPWVIDDEACVVASKFTHLKARLEPYLTNASIRGVVQQGVPLMRAMLLEFPADRNVWNVDTQYMLGSDLLVAPVFGERHVEYYLPAGAWTNVLTGDEVSGGDGGRWITEEHGMMTLPLLLRPGAVLVLGRKGHGVRDSIAARGFTLVLSRNSLKASVTVALRGGKSVTVEITPTAKDGEVVGLTATLTTGKTLPFEVLVIGNGKGLDAEADGAFARAEAKKNVCEVLF